MTNPLNASGVYMITCTANSKVYVGSAAIFRKRRDRHWQHLRNGVHDNQHLQRAWQKYGPAAFAFEVLEIVTDREQMIEREQHWIDTLGTLENGYNMMPAVRNASYQLLLDEAERERRSERLKLRHQDPAYAQKLAAARRERYAADPAFRADVTRRMQEKRRLVSVSPETRLRMSEGHTERKKAIVVMKPDGEIIEYLGVSTFCREYFPDAHTNARKGVGEVLAGTRMAYRDFRVAYKGTPEEAELRLARAVTAPNWRLHLPSGEVLELVHLTKYCRDNGLNDGSLHKAQGGKTYRGHSVEWIGPDRSGERRPFYRRKRTTATWKGVAFMWVLTAPDGTEHRTAALSEVCRQYGLFQSVMSLVADGKRKGHKGWLCRRELIGP